MKNVHLTFERAVEAATGEKPLNAHEKEHVSICFLCQGRIRAADSTDEVLMNSKKVVPFIDSNKILEMADKVFEQETSPEKSFPVYKIFAVAASLILIIAAVAFFAERESSKIEKPVKKTAKIDKERAKEPEKKAVDKLPVGVMQIAEGSVFQGERCELKALSKSKVTVESESYFIVEKGKVQFSVTKGEDFMVKLNGHGLVRVLGTVFTVDVKEKESSVEVSEGLVELIDLGRGTSKQLAVGQSGVVRKIVRKIAQKTPVKKVKPVKKVVKKNIEETIEVVKQTEVKKEKKKAAAKFKFSNDQEMIKAEINDLEFSLKFSETPVKELYQLFILYSKAKRFGAILNFWRSKSSIIKADNNLNLKVMHFHACKASIGLNVYNKICSEYKTSYPDGPFPSGMDYHLKMTQ